MVCSPWRHGAGVTAHRDSVANYLDRRFDGDALNVSIAMDKFMADSWYPLEPRFNVLDMNKPYGVSGNPAMPKPVISSISSWIEG